MALSPMMTQYLKIKEEYSDTLLLFRLGDFYELFFDDALTASKALDLTLTGRDCGLEERAPMCGVPYHAAESYIAKLIELGFKVAVAEQMSEPKQGVLVDREVTRVITAGTVMDAQLLDEKTNNYLFCLFFSDKTFGAAWSDITTGEFNIAQYGSDDISGLKNLLSSVRPSEIICNEDMLDKRELLTQQLLDSLPPFSVSYSPYFEYSAASELIAKVAGEQNLAGLSDKKYGVCAAGALLGFVENTQKKPLRHLNHIDEFSQDKYMKLDHTCKRNLELTSTMTERRRRGSLLGVMDKTSTSVGARLFSKWIENPLYDSHEINRRLDGVEELFKNTIVRDDIVRYLSSYRDVIRLAAKLSSRNLAPTECLAILNTTRLIPSIKKLLAGLKSEIFKDINFSLKTFEPMERMISATLCDDPPALTKDGGYIRDGFDPELDSYRSALRNSKEWLTRIENIEREESGIKNLKISYNKVFGYYIEISKGQLSQVPFRYIRKQTLTTGERFITPELKEVETKLLSAQDNSVALEQRLFDELCDKMREYINDIIAVSNAVAALDCLTSLAIQAKENNYCKPVINTDINAIKIIEGRHPVVESLLKKELFVPNDVLLDSAENRTLIITGPNMAGKSTYMRQVALITIMAHIGSFVPAKKAEICLVDRVFTRVGASDELAFGQSTFLVEMSEVASILANATPDSLLILDEIGRGTSTFDGLSIAWAVTEYVAATLRAKTMFATHYHELSELEGSIAGIKNYKVSVKEINNSIVFLRKITRGSANKSFGVEVASLAGVPKSILQRSKEILKKLENADIARQQTSPLTTTNQLSIFGNTENAEIINILKDIDIDNLTPVMAFNILIDLAEKAGKNNGKH